MLRLGRRSLGIAVVVALAAAGAALAVGSRLVRRGPMRMEWSRASVAADGASTASVRVSALSGPAPEGCQLQLSDGNLAALRSFAQSGDVWLGVLRARSLPGTLTVRAICRAGGTATSVLRLTPSWRDFAGDGMPDFARLTSPADQQAFRRWFNWLAEWQFARPRNEIPAEINDCAALLRFAFRGALRVHDGNWAQDWHLRRVPQLASVERYAYPYTALGANLFRVRPGAFRAADLTDGSFAQFADARALMTFNAHLVGRDVSRALPGDLLFFRQHRDRPSLGHSPYHSMIYLGPSQFEDAAGPFVVYHTGPIGDLPGEIRRPSLADLEHFPDAEWRPVVSNPQFLGVYRWNLLRKGE